MFFLEGLERTNLVSIHLNGEISFECDEPDHRSPDIDSPNPWGSIEPRLKTTGLDYFIGPQESIVLSKGLASFLVTIAKWYLLHIPASVHELYID